MQALRKSGLFAMAIVLCVSCGDDQTSTETIVTSVTSGTALSEVSDSASITTSDVPTTTEESPTTGGLPNGSCGDVIYPIPNAPFSVVFESSNDEKWEEICPSLDPGMNVLDVRIYRPDPLPETPLPFVVMTNGAGQFASVYGHVLQPLAARGFVVASVQSDGSVYQRANALACTVRWLRKKWAVENGVTPNCDLILMGHSRGGEASWILGNTLENMPWMDINPEGVDMNLAALVGIAPKMGDNVTPYNPSHAVPYLGIMGSSDEDVTGQGIRAYDEMVRESQRTENDPVKLFLWPYDVPHNAFGGVGSIPTPESAPLSSDEYIAKGNAILAAYVPVFVDLFVLGDSTAHEVFTGADVPDELTPGGNVDWWSYLEPAFSELGGGPVVLRDFVADQRKDPGSRMSVDDFEGGIKFSTSMSSVVVGGHPDLDEGIFVPLYHRENVMRVRWGNLELGGEIAWELDDGSPVDLSDKSFFSLRIGQELVLESPPTTTCGLSLGDPRADSIELTVRLEDDQAVIAEAELGPIIQQHMQWGSLMGSSKDICVRGNFMSTMRIAMSEFCASPGFDPGAVVSVVVEFPTFSRDVGVYIDTLEFTSAAADASGLCEL